MVHTTAKKGGGGLESQTVINLLGAGFVSVAGWSLRKIVSDIKANDESSKDLADRVHKIEVLVAGNYITRDEFDKYMHRMFNKLDSISDKLDQKADK